MSLGSLLLLLSLAVVALPFLLRPFLESFENESEPFAGTPGEDHPEGELLSQKMQVLKAIQEFDFDFALGKIPPEEYSSQRSALIHLGATILRRIDERSAEGPKKEPAAGGENRAGKSSRRREQQDDDLEELIAARRRARAGRSPGFCPHCGKPMEKTDRYCSGCGRTAVE